jgi:hypothetical protein
MDASIPLTPDLNRGEVKAAGLDIGKNPVPRKPEAARCFTKSDQGAIALA